MSLDSVLAALLEIRWGSAGDWDPRARDWLREYYRRLQRYWPEDRPRIPPADTAVVEAVLDSRGADDRELVAGLVTRVVDAARGRGESLEWTTRQLVPLLLAWELAVDAGELEADANPGAPLLELFRAGFQMKYTHAGIELHYATGWMTAPVPTRAQLADAPAPGPG